MSTEPKVKDHTPGYKSTEFLVVIVVILSGLLVISGQVACQMITGKDLGVDIQNLFYALTGIGGLYGGYRTTVKSRNITGLSHQYQIDGELEKVHYKQMDFEKDFSVSDYLEKSDKKTPMEMTYSEINGFEGIINQDDVKTLNPKSLTEETQVW